VRDDPPTDAQERAGARRERKEAARGRRASMVRKVTDRPDDPATGPATGPAKGEEPDD
jgi:hypothetical protein